MKKFFLKLALSILNISFLGIANAMLQQPGKAVLYQFFASVLFAIGGYFEIFATFHGALIIYSFILFIYVYAFADILHIRDFHFAGWLPNFLKYAAAVIVIKLFFVLPVRLYFYEPVRLPAENGYDYFVKDKKTDKLLYMFWSSDQ